MKGLGLQILKASTESEIDAAFVSLVQLRAAALVLGADQFIANRREQIIALAARYTVPAIGWYPYYAVSGGLMSYGINSDALLYQIGLYVGRILKGEKPADLPVQRPTIFKLVINLKTARALGLTVPQSLLARADEVIE